MEAPSPSDDAVGLVRRWTVLVILSGIVALGLQAVRLPAALLLGPMIAAIVVALSGSQLRVAPQPVLIAQAVIEDLTLVTADAAIRRYDVATLDASA